MWYEIFLPLGCLFVTTSVPALLLPYIHKWQQSGNAYKRDIDYPGVQSFWFRDHHLSGDPYAPNGIELLPDEPPEQFRKKN